MSRLPVQPVRGRAAAARAGVVGERRRSSWAALTATVCSTQVSCSWLWLQWGPGQTCTGAANWPLAICNAATLPRASGMSWSAWDPGCDCSLTDCLWRSIHQTSATCGRVVTMSCVAQKACGSSSIISVGGRADTNVLRLCASGTGSDPSYTAEGNSFDGFVRRSNG